MATTTLNFTKNSIDRIILPDKGREFYRDSKERYLYLFVTPHKKTFYYIRRINGRVRQLKLDNFPQMTVFLARQRAVEISAEIASGKDLESKKQEEDQKTFGELFDIYLEQHLKAHARTWKEDKRRMDVYFPSWKRKKACSISRNDVISLHNKLKKERGATTANRVVQLIKRVFNYHIKNASLNLNNPVINLKLFNEETRSRYMNADELKDFFNALDQEESDIWKDFFSLALFTGARRSNIQSMKWDEIDFSKEVWKIPAKKFKNGQECVIPLVPQATLILKKRESQKDNKNDEFVFASPSETGHLMDPRRAWNRILKRTKIKNLRLHDLRRTFGSWQAAGGASLQIIGKSLGHNSHEATEIYSHLDLDPVRNSMTNATQTMIDTITPKKNKKKSALKQLENIISNINENQAKKILTLIEGNY